MIPRAYCVYRYIYIDMDRLHRLIYNKVYIYIHVYSMHVYTFVFENQPNHSISVIGFLPVTAQMFGRRM